MMSIRMTMGFVSSLVVVVGVLVLGVASASAAGDENQAACPNEAARIGASASLPECRAYELVTPAFKNGFPVGLRYVSAGGTRIKAESVGLFAGETASSCPFNEYALTRDASGWHTQPLANVSLNEYAYPGPACQPILMTEEGASLLQLHPTVNSVYERDLYISKPGQALTEVGPMLPRSAVPPTPVGSGEQAPNSTTFTFVAGGTTLANILFELPPLEPRFLPNGIKTQLWPADTTTLTTPQAGASSLYEYSGTANLQPPELVGVNNNGTLISDCSTWAGGFSEVGEHRHVISANGQFVFFTAAGMDDQLCKPEGHKPFVDQIYARVNRAETINLSEPTPNDSCSDPTCTINTQSANEAADFRDANFEGASEDGSKVFFTSTQQLTNEASEDPNLADSAVVNQGEKGCAAIPGVETGTVGPNGCNLYEYNFNEATGARLKLLSAGDSSGLGPEVQGVGAISEDGSHVYFVAGGVLTSVPRGGENGICVEELAKMEREQEENTHEGRCRPKKGADNLYVANTVTGTTSFVATLSSAEVDGGQWTFNGGSANGTGPMNTTNSGNFVVFTTPEKLTGDDEANTRQVFRFEAAKETLVRVSIGNEGFNEDGNGGHAGATVSTYSSTKEESSDIADEHPAISENGAIVVFQSGNALTPAALNDECVFEEEGTCFQYAQNSYEYEGGRVYLISDPSGPLVNGSPPVVTPSGNDVFFETQLSLVSQDGDSLADIYDARVDGGMSPPTSVEECEGEACQDTQAAKSPQGGVPDSGTFVGPESPVSPLPSTSGSPARHRLTAAEERAKRLVTVLKRCRALHNKTARKNCGARARKRYGPRKKLKRQSRSER
jgi:hypothetical protein